MLRFRIIGHASSSKAAVTGMRETRMMKDEEATQAREP